MDQNTPQYPEKFTELQKEFDRHFARLEYELQKLIVRHQDMLIAEQTLSNEGKLR